MFPLSALRKATSTLLCFTILANGDFEHCPNVTHLNVVVNWFEELNRLAPPGN